MMLHVSPMGNLIFLDTATSKELMPLVKTKE
jgi:hypothetical protein